MRRAYVLYQREEGAPESYWTGDRWSPWRTQAKEFGSRHDAEAAHQHLDTDRDVRVLVVIGARSAQTA